MASRRRSATTSDAGPKISPSGVTVRMYRQGLGDCFLLGFPTRSTQPVFMLIDCGVVMGTPDAEARMRAVVENIKQVTGGHLHVLVVTHEHWDHLSGFLQARDVFEQMQIDEVWLPWTEDPNDPQGRELQRRRHSSIQDLSRTRDLLKEVSPTASRVETGLDSYSPGPRGKRTVAALEAVQAWGRTRRYHRPGGTPVALPGAEDVRVYVLGPPEAQRIPEGTRGISRKALAQDPEEAFFAAVRAATQGPEEQPADPAMPFDASLRVSLAEARHDPFFSAMYSSSESWRQIDSDWLEVAGPLTVRLERDINSLSLVLAVELVESGRVLLFPGDAQAPSWQTWHDLSWTVRAADGSLSQVIAQDLLRRTVLYKVSHHGSHSGTARELGLDLMVSPELTALVPVDEEMASKRRWVMPFPALLTRLDEQTRGRILRSDRGVPQDLRSAPLAPSALVGGIREEDLFLEVVVSKAVQGRDDLARRLEEALRGPILENYDGYATARLITEAGGELGRVAPGGRCRVVVRLVPEPPDSGVFEPITIEGGEDVPEAAFDVTVDAGSLTVDPMRVTLVAAQGRPSEEATLTLGIPADQKVGPYPVYVQIFQKTELLRVLRAELQIGPARRGGRR